MINGAKIDTLEYDEETEVYTDLELKDMIKFVRKLLRDDDKEIMPADVTTEDKEFWYEEAKEWFEDLYDYIPEGEMEIFDPELSAEETGVEDGMIDLGPVETEVFTVEQTSHRTIELIGVFEQRTPISFFCEKTGQEQITTMVHSKDKKRE